MNNICLRCLTYQNLCNRIKLCSCVYGSKLIYFPHANKDLSIKHSLNVSFLMTMQMKPLHQKLVFRRNSTHLGPTDEPKNVVESSKEKDSKKQSKFKQFYSQYGPLFIVVHLTTVVLWIYFFYIVSKQ